MMIFCFASNPNFENVGILWGLRQKSICLMHDRVPLFKYDTINYSFNVIQSFQVSKDVLFQFLSFILFILQIVVYTFGHTFWRTGHFHTGGRLEKYNDEVSFCVCARARPIICFREVIIKKKMKVCILSKGGGGCQTPNPNFLDFILVELPNLVMEKFI